MTQYNLPQKWIDYLVNQPETGMSYQVADIYLKDLKGKKLKNIIILGCSTFNHKNKKLNLDTIEKIVVKEREGYEEIKKFQTVSVKNTPTGGKKMEKYYLIEEYETINTEPYGRWEGITKYEVRKFETSKQLKEAILKGPLHKGKLIPTKGLELKLQIIEEENHDPTPWETWRDDFKVNPR